MCYNSSAIILVDTQFFHRTIENKNILDDCSILIYIQHIYYIINMSDIQEFDTLLKLAEWALTKDYKGVAEGKSMSPLRVVCFLNKNI